jgi:hypothetical protein
MVPFACGRVHATAATRLNTTADSSAHSHFAAVPILMSFNFEST